MEIASTRADPRADPQATQKISREDLEEALRRTKSGTRAKVRPSPVVERGSLPGPRDDEEESSVVPVEPLVIDPALSAAPGAPPASTSAITPSLDLRAVPPSSVTSARRLHVTPQLVFLVGLALAAVVMLALIAGFFAGRITLP